MAKTVLIVEDDALGVRLLTRWLEREGFSLRLAESAEAALALLEGEAVDAILMDIELPGISGFEAIGRFKKISAAPILIMTGHSDGQIREDALALGAKFFLPKPFDIEELTSLLRRAVSS